MNVAFLKKYIYPLFLLLCLIVIVSLVYHILYPKRVGIPKSVQVESKEADIRSTPSEVETASENEKEQQIEENISFTDSKKTKSYIEQEKEAEIEILPVDNDVIYIANDIHYYSKHLTDFGVAFYEKLLNEDDGKAIEYIPDILDVWIESVLRSRPATVLLPGDVAFNGEKDAHIELAEKLKRLTDAGIQVLVIPGNHDIYDTHAASYFGEERIQVDTVSPEEFYEIYQDFGYNQSFSRDVTSLSYAYRLDENRIIVMLDSAIYEPLNLVGGRIKEGTLIWLEDVLAGAKARGEEVLVSGHHNLLSESRLYTTDVHLENYTDFLEILEKYEISLYLSGHLHLQRIGTYQSEPSDTSDHITEIVTGAFSMYPFPYGKLIWTSEGMCYRVVEVEMESDLKEAGLDAFRCVIEYQIEKQIKGLPADISSVMYTAYTDLMQAYVAGEYIDLASFEESEAYGYFKKYMLNTNTLNMLEAILYDSRKEHKTWEKELE